MKKLTLILLLIIAAVTAFAAEPNNIKVGTAKLTVVINNPDSVNIDNAVVWVDTAPIFIDFFDTLTFKPEKEGDVFSGEIPLDLIEEIVGVRFECDGKGFGYILNLYQHTPVNVSFSVNNDCALTEVASSDANTLTYDDNILLADIYFRFVAPEVVGIVPTEMYDSWKKVREYENTVLYPKALKYATDGYELPENLPGWFINSLKCRFASVNTIPYVKAAERINHIAVEEPPMESYSFLDSIDYSPLFLTRLPYTGLKSFIYALLRFPEGGFGKIGEEPVDQWQARAKEKMLPAISNPTQLLLDLLAAMSYVEQVEINRQPLSATQIANVMTGFPDNDLDKIIIEKNAKLMASSGNKSNVHDLSAVTFDLKRYIDKMYPDKPVIVDLWNTWCSPCLDAISKTEILRKEMPDTDIVFLYVSDESSDFGEWECRVADMDGINLRINKEDSEKIGEDYSLTGFPSYLIYNREHELVHGQTAFPGVSEYKKWIEQIK